MHVLRFLDVPGEEPHRPELQAVFNRMVQRLGEVGLRLGKAHGGRCDLAEMHGGCGAMCGRNGRQRRCV